MKNKKMIIGEYEITDQQDGTFKVHRITEYGVDMYCEINGGDFESYLNLLFVSPFKLVHKSSMGTSELTWSTVDSKEGEER